MTIMSERDVVAKGAVTTVGEHMASVIAERDATIADLRTQLAAAQSEVSYLKGLYEDANGLRAAAEHRAETAERERDHVQTLLGLRTRHYEVMTDAAEQLESECKALRHRAETAEREREALQQFAALQDAWETEAMGDITMLLKERNEYRHRAERLESQIDAVRSLCADMQDYTALKVLELLDDASEGEA